MNLNMLSRKCEDCVWSHIVTAVSEPMKFEETITVCRAVIPNMVIEGQVIDCSTFQDIEDAKKEDEFDD